MKEGNYSVLCLNQIKYTLEQCPKPRFFNKLPKQKKERKKILKFSYKSQFIILSLSLSKVGIVCSALVALDTLRYGHMLNTRHVFIF